MILPVHNNLSLPSKCTKSSAAQRASNHTTLVIFHQASINLLFLVTECFKYIKLNRSHVVSMKFVGMHIEHHIVRLFSLGRMNAP